MPRSARKMSGSGVYHVSRTKEPSLRPAFIGYGISLVIAQLILSFNDSRYATQIPNIWYMIFSASLLGLWLFIGKKKKIMAMVILGANLILFLVYILLLPQFTYKEAISELSNHYPENVLSPAPNKSYQSLAPYYEMDKLKYYRYIVEYNGQYMYFDQYTGAFGEVITAP